MLSLEKVADFSFFHVNYVNVQKRMKQNGKISLNDNEQVNFGLSTICFEFGRRRYRVTTEL